MKKTISLFSFVLLFHSLVLAQVDDFRERYNTFQNQVQADYNDFRNKVNQEYAEFVREAWKQYKLLPAIPSPKEEPVPPTIYPKDEEDKQIRNSPILIDEIIPIAEPIPQPKPVVPIKEESQPIRNYFSFRFFGTEANVRLNEKLRFRLKSCSGEDLAKAWKVCSSKEYNNVIRDCLDLRIRYNLCDWAYLLMLKEMTVSFFGANNNEAVLLMAYLYCQSGYKMRLGQSENRLVFLYASQYNIYEHPYYEISGEIFYPMDFQEKELYICEASFPNEQPLSLAINKELLLQQNMSPMRRLQSKRYPETKVNVSTNKNLIDFYNTYPTSEFGNNFMTRWVMYANTPLNRETKNTLYPVLQSTIKEKSQKEAVEYLLNFVQTAFVYEYDEKVWGKDRAFFAEETLYYPYSDCEDRAILFSRLVRDLLGLKVALIYYPGHLATAVCFVEPIKGDYVLINNTSYTICDPTYIGAPVGVSMPEMDNRTAKGILLE